jgi:hypothetical protein
MPDTPPSPAAVARLLLSGVALLRAEIEALPDALLGFHPAPGEWCVKEVLGHLIEADRRGFDGRIRLLLAEDSPALEAWDQVAVARARRDCEREAPALLAELGRMREASARLVAGLEPPGLARAGQHPRVGLLRVADLLQEWVHHDRTHVKQILGNVQAYVWPHMGNAQKFSDA